MDEQMRDQALTMALGILIATMVGVGILSMFLGQVIALLDRLRAWAGGLHSAPASPRTELAPPVQEQQNQVRADWAEDFEAVSEWIGEHNVTPEQALELLAKLHYSPDSHVVSANKIRDAIGGSRDEVLAAVASHRPKPAQPRPSARLERPANGWGKPSSS